MTVSKQHYQQLPQHLEMDIPKEQFPIKLYTILELARSGNLGTCSDENVITWLPHGRGFKLNDEDKFMTIIAPSFFKQTKIRSFTRQLNMWGFKK